MTRQACALHPGDHIHVTPHDVFRYSGCPHHVNCGTADVPVQAEPIPMGDVVVICCRIGTWRWWVVYDRDAPVELVEVA